MLKTFGILSVVKTPFSLDICQVVQLEGGERPVSAIVGAVTPAATLRCVISATGLVIGGEPGVTSSDAAITAVVIGFGEECLFLCG
ncbi:MAG: hypothetical protein GY722_17495 [bacterium]|nr:hypothetical protein [bacterium]